jgi:pimeloyl-ACP methyl ester carboxylesterase
MHALFVILSLVAALVTAVPANAGPAIATETFLIPSSDPQIKLYVRNKHSANQQDFSADKVALFVHGATYPSETAFDIDLPGGSWMDYMVKRGFDTYMVDVRGYGGSTRPPSMDAPPDKNPPFATTADAVKDVGAAVDFILKRRNIKKLNLIGWSWGTAIMASYTTKNNDKVVKLVLYAPLWLLKAPPPFSGTGAYRSVTKEAARARGLRGIPKGREEEISPQAWFDKWWAANLATDPVGAKQNPPVLRAPNGVLKDVVEKLGKGIPVYDPAEIRVPTLLIRAEWDQDTPQYMANEIFSKLVNTPYKSEVILSGGAHTAVLEKNRMRLISQVQFFLEEKP